MNKKVYFLILYSFVSIAACASTTKWDYTPKWQMAQANYNQAESDCLTEKDQKKTKKLLRCSEMRSI